MMSNIDDINTDNVKLIKKIDLQSL